MTDRPDTGQPVGQASDRHAARILQAVLDDLTRAIWNNDPVLLRQLTADPHTIMTKEGVKVFRFGRFVSHSQFVRLQTHDRHVRLWIHQAWRPRTTLDGSLETTVDVSSRDDELSDLAL